MSLIITWIIWSIKNIFLSLIRPNPRWNEALVLTVTGQCNRISAAGNTSGNQTAERLWEWTRELFSASGQTLRTQERMHCFLSAGSSAEGPVMNSDTCHDALDSATSMFLSPKISRKIIEKAPNSNSPSFTSKAWNVENIQSEGKLCTTSSDVLNLLYRNITEHLPNFLFPLL